MTTHSTRRLWRLSDQTKRYLRFDGAAMVGVVTAASFAFMFPVATPLNAIVFGSGYISVPQMAKVGVGLNLIGILLITLFALFWLPVAWGIEIATVPNWAG